MSDVSKRTVVLRWTTVAMLGTLVAGYAVYWGRTAPDELGVALGDVLPLPSINGEAFYLDASDIVRRGSSRVVVIRLKGPGEFVPYHYKHQKLDSPESALGWMKELGAPLVVNAGQFDENLEHLGWLKQDSEWLSAYRKPQWNALLLSGPVDGGAWARVADLEQADPSVEKRYKHVVQSMMLVDDGQRMRVRDTQRTACRTVIGEDTQGRILIILTEGAITLGDMARWLPKQGIGIVRAMNLDGGVEAQLAIHTKELDFTMFGQFGTGTTVFEGGAGAVRYPIPAVIAWRPSSASE